MLWPELSPESAALALRQAGLALAPDALRLEAREARWLVALPQGQLAWFPASEAGLALLERERRVLALLAERCRFGAPRLLHTSPSGFDLRQKVPGDAEPWALYARLGQDDVACRRLGRAVGELLAEQHSRVDPAGLAGWLPERPAWPEPDAWIRERLPGVVDEPELHARIAALLERCAALPVPERDRVLVHGDLGLHNLAIDAATLELHGAFDYADASLADRHLDFRYLAFDQGREGVLEAALEAYAALTGRALSAERIWLHNAACAACFLAYRRGTPPEARSCGRILAEDLAWTRAALARVGL